VSSHAHLDRFEISKDRSVWLGTVIGRSGESGDMLGGPHLHLQVCEIDRMSGTWKRPGFDPFTLGIDGGRPVYHDCITRVIYDHPLHRQTELAYVLEAVFPERVAAAPDIDEATRKDLLARRSDATALSDYLRRRVLERRPSPQPAYEFLPGSFMYAWMLRILGLTRPYRFVAMLPFPHPLNLASYAKENRHVVWH
jgi:hypothetical protein